MEDKNVTFTFQWSKELRDRFGKMAKQSDRSMARQLKSIIKEACEKYEYEQEREQVGQPT